jgi:hypothetical protein
LQAHSAAKCNAQIALLRCTISGMVGRNRLGERKGFMSKNNTKAWNTKYGTRRVRRDEPTLEEAIVAAQGLSDDLNEQAEIAASLMGLPWDQVRAELLKRVPPRKDVVKSFAFTGSPSAPRTVVVERKPSRRVIPAADRAARPATGAVRALALESNR